ncbi:MAG TPA: ABC transporter ATP-binding protein, partial [Ruminococcaceae bacterium]|nr:ABC transporter ATP-binding protein [Oscillospiraceae bacterium]
MESVEWLEKFLGDYRGAYLVISHDRYFLDKTTERTIELENGRVIDYKGNYTRFLELKAERLERIQKEYDAAMKEIGRVEGIIEQQKRWNQAHNYVTIASKQKQIDRIAKTLEKPEDAPDAIKFAFKSADGCGNDVLTARNLSLSFGEKRLFSNVNIEIKKGERVFLIGGNGCG